MVPPPAFLPVSLLWVVDTPVGSAEGKAGLSTQGVPLQSVLIVIADKGKIEHNYRHCFGSSALKSTTSNRENRQTAELMYHLLVIQAQTTETK